MASGARGFFWRQLGDGCLLVWLALAALLVASPASGATIHVDGSCTLIEAINAANGDLPLPGCTAGSGHDTIELTGDVTLSAPWAGLDGLPPITSEITIDGNGWAVERAGGPVELRIFRIVSGGDLTLRRVTVSNGRVTAQPQGGGCLYNQGILELIDSTVSGCQVVGATGYATGGAILNLGTLVVNGSTISTNSIVSTIGGVAGGGIESGVGTTVSITNSTISGNYAVSTISTGHGGGLSLLQSSTVLRNCTLSGNSATTAGAALLADDGTTVMGSIIGNSVLSVNCGGFPELINPGENQADDDSCSTIPDTLTGLDPALRDNGGPTWTHALLDGSSAILGAPTCGLAEDQRGAPRGVFCDGGAFEYGGCPELVLSDDTVSATELHEECRIQVGPNYGVMGPNGDLTLRGGREVELGDDFSVGFDGDLTIEIDGSLIP